MLNTQAFLNVTELLVQLKEKLSGSDCYYSLQSKVPTLHVHYVGKSYPTLIEESDTVESVVSAVVKHVLEDNK